MKSLLEQLKKPVVTALVAGLVGFLLGLLWGWVIQPVEWINATPKVLRPDLQKDYLNMAIDSYMINKDPILAVQRFQALGESGPQLLAEVQQSPGNQDQGTVLAFGQLMNTISNLTPSPESEIATLPNIGKYVVIGVAVIVVLGVLSAVIYFFRPRLRSRGSSPVIQAQQNTPPKGSTDYESLGVASPITQSMTTYVLGDDLYDESFSIDSPAGEFMGEYGVGVSETIGVGDPKKVTALEIWLFDKNDIKTATKVLMSENAYNDLASRQRLEAKGELVLIEPQKQVVLETATLQLLANLTDVEYGQGPLPQNSYFERVTLELAVWSKTE